MTNFEKIGLCLSICIPIVSFFCYLLVLACRRIVSRKNPEKLNRNVPSQMLVFPFLLFFAIWGVRLALAYVLAKGKDSVAVALVDSFFHSLRVFSVEDSYPDLINGVGVLAEALAPVQGSILMNLKAALTVYITALELIAPVVGAALILEVLAKIFPKIRLYFVCCFPLGRTRYYFSKLNAASLALAKNIAQEESDRKQRGGKIKWYIGKPVIIFTDTHIDDEEEKDYELLLEAKHCGAICVRDDLFHARKPRFGKREYYLMDPDEFGNLQTLMNLVEESCIPCVLDSSIHLFVQSDAYVSVENRAKKKLEKALDKNKKWKRKGAPVFIPVRSYRNLVSNLFRDVPLYEPLVGRKENVDSLNVIILGNGRIGTEAFLHTYWMGQIMTPDSEGNLKDVKLTINVISKEDPKAFWSKIDYINPEIQKSAVVYKEKSFGDNNETEIPPEESILRYNETERNEPYCTIRYIQADVKNGGFWDGNQEKKHSLLGADYYIVALGNDAHNISVAEKLRCLVGKAHLECSGEINDVAKKTVIAYAVFDSKLAEALNQEQLYACRSKEKADIYTYAFGSLESVYSCNNVYMTQSRLLAEETGARYQKEHKDSYLSAHKKRAENEDRNYNYWSNMAKALHVKYKIFSLGWIQKSVFDGGDVQKEEAKKQFLRYKKMALADGIGSVTFDGESDAPHLAEQKELLAWLEHRRWCAYTRADGYRYTAEVIKNLDLNGKNHKNMSLKLHPCLVEAKRPTGITYRHPKVESVFEDGKTNAVVEKELDALEHEPLDRLDRLSCQIRRESLTREIKTYDFKEFDRPAFDFDGYKLCSKMKNELEGCGVLLPKGLFESEENEDFSVTLKKENGESVRDYFFSVSNVKERLQKKYHRIEADDTAGFLIDLYKNRQNKNAFYFENSLFMTRLAFAMAVLRHWKAYFRKIANGK